MPVVETSDKELRVGAATAGADALGYHSWAATATWSVARQAALQTVAPGARPDLSLFYAYDRWAPTLYAQASDETTPLLLPASARAPERPAAIRERSLEAGVLFRARRVRHSQMWLAAYRFDRAAVSGPYDEGTAQRGSARAGWGFSNAHRYGYSISEEDGVTLGASAELTRRAFGGDANAYLLRSDVRAFIPLGPRHAVVAVRATGATTGGDRQVRRLLRLGGAQGEPGVLSFASDASSLLRGFPSNAFVGPHVALANAEYRLPIAWIERGHGTWPLFIRAVHGTMYVDVGNAWSDRARWRDRKISWGAEVSTDVIAGFVLPLTLTAGVGWGRDGENLFPPTRTTYVRLGHGF
jgi:peptidoglycan hydrolase-like protein with peptidoglycan-binding domain